MNLSNHPIKNLIGQRFGKLVVIEYAGKNNSGRTTWLCRCDCDGKTKIINGNSMVQGWVNSCGCLHDGHPTHGLSDTPTHNTWVKINQRCSNPNNPSWKNYGGRGITVCDRWKESFKNFLEDMGIKPKGRFSIGRINNDGNYEPENCEWEDDLTQANNRRDNHLITYRNRTQTISQWAREYNISCKVLADRITKCKWPIEQALTEPIHPGVSYHKV